MRTLSWKQKAKIAWMVFWHPKTSFTAKATIAGGLLYGLMLFDFIPDILPILGIADDATFLVFAFILFLHLTKNIREELQKKNDIIDVNPL